jgi:outer membrane protein TolC
VAVTLESCLRRALVGSLRIQIARYGPAVALTAVREAEAMFDPSWFMNNALARVRQDAGTFLAGAGTLSAKQWESSSGVDALLPTGGSFAFSQDWTYLDSNSAFFAPNPQYATQLGLTVRQPLLRGAGVEVTRSPITLARLDHRISVEQFKAEVMDALLTVEAAYWQLVLSESQVEAIAEAVAAAEENRRIARRRFEEGKDTRVILSLAESAVTSREADLVAARLRLVRLSDLLKRLIQDPALPLEEPSVLMASETPMSEPPSVDRRTLQSAMLTAMARRPEMQQAEQRLEQAGVQVRVARSDRLPQLDFAGGYAVTGLEADLDRSLREEYQTEFFNWTVGLAFRVPIGNRAREAAYERTRLVQSQAIQQREDTRQRVLLEVSETVRTLAAAEESVRATRAARVAAEQTLRDQQANVAAGAALVKDLLDSQRDLADSKVREMDAMVQYMTALAALERAKGTLLEYNGIAILEEDAGSRAAKRP